jgi:hypothetical protein
VPIEVVERRSPSQLRSGSIPVSRKETTIFQLSRRGEVSTAPTTSRMIGRCSFFDAVDAVNVECRRTRGGDFDK